MSAYSNLVGLYPSSKNFKLPENLVSSNNWPEMLPWQPIPVHTVPRPMDHVRNLILKKLSILFYL